MQPKTPEPAMISPEIVVQADIGGMTIAFTTQARGDAATINAHLDLFAKAISRQRAQAELIEALVDVRAIREALALSPERERATMKGRTDERVRMIAAFEASHNARGARSAFGLNAAQRQGLQNFDAETEQKRAEFASDRENAAAELPRHIARVARQRAIIAGADRADVIEDDGEPLAIAAE